MSAYAEPVTLKGDHVTLTPLGREHAGDLFVLIENDPEVWQYLPNHVPTSPAEMETWVDESRAQEARLPFAVVDNASGHAIGSTSYGNISEPNRNLEIGWTWYGRAYWRSAVNTECKYLLMRRAFDDLGCIRVQLRTDERNQRSQRAIERLGCTREGLLRQVQIVPAWGGHRRSIVFYSLLEDEWPARKAWFEERLAAGGSK